MIITLVILVHVIIAWHWGDWRNWNKYQSTILYMITSDLVYNFLTYNYSLWEYEPTIVYPNHTLTNLTAIFVSYPSAMLVYLGRYPTKRIKQFLWISFWVVYWSFNEWVVVKFGEFSYHNGWNLMGSVLLNIGLFSFVRLHYKKPLLTYGLSVIATIGLVVLFKVPILKMK